MTPGERKAQFRVIAEAAKAENTDSIVIALVALGVDVRDALRSPAALKMKRWRESRPSNNVTASVTQNGATASHARDSGVVAAARSLSDSSFGSSSSESSSLEQGSDLEGAGARFVVPESFAIPEMVSAYCAMHFGRRPEPADAAAFCSNERKRLANGERPRFSSLEALLEGFKLWMRNQRPPRSSARPVQPSNPKAPWMQEDHGALTDAGDGTT